MRWPKGSRCLGRVAAVAASLGREVPEDAPHCAHGALNIDARRLPVADRNAHTASAMPRRAAEKGFPGRNDPADDLVRSAVMIRIGCARPRIEKAHQTLVDRRLPDDLRTRQAADARDQGASMNAGTVDQLGNARPSELTQRRVGWNGAAAPRPIGVPVDLVARIVYEQRVT